MTEIRTDAESQDEPKAREMTLKTIVMGYIKWGLIIDLVLSVIGVVVQDTLLGALANLAHFHGVGYILAVVGSSILAFIVNFFIGVVALIVIAGGIFVAFAVYAFFSGRGSQGGQKQ